MTALIINRSDSRCGMCGKNADPHETEHRMERMRGEGCGAPFTEMTSDYTGMEEACKRLRPDLPWKGLW